MKLDKAAEWLDMQRSSSKTASGKAGGDNKLSKVVKDSSKMAEEQLKCLARQVVKNVPFNGGVGVAAVPPS